MLINKFISKEIMIKTAVYVSTAKFLFLIILTIYSKAL